jgi:hypothetical protein
MFGSGVEGTVVLTGIAVWFAQGWYLNERLRKVHDKLDRVLEQFDGLRVYLYERDPQFDDERQLFEDFNEAQEKGTMSFAGKDHLDLIRKKESQGRRTLNTPLWPGP